MVIHFLITFNISLLPDSIPISIEQQPASFIREMRARALPHKATSKHNIRFVPNQSLEGLLHKIRAHLDSCGYEDVELRKLGGYPWALVDHKNPVAEAMYDTFEEFNVGYTINPPVANSILTSPAWPAYLFAREPLNLPIISGSLGNGELSHSPNEYFVIEGCEAKYGRIYGLAGVEKGNASTLYRARINSVSLVF